MSSNRGWSLLSSVLRQNKIKPTFFIQVRFKARSLWGRVNKYFSQLNTACLRTPNGGTGWPTGYSWRGGVELATKSASGREEGLNLRPLNYKASVLITGHACLTRHAVCLFFPIQCSQKILFVTLFKGYGAGAFNLLYLFHFNFVVLFTFRVLQKAVSRCPAAR